MNTTTCFHCGQDFPDREMMLLPNEGELCAVCWDTLRDAAPALLAALAMFVAAVDLWQDDDLEARSGSDFIATCETTAEIARAAILEAKGAP